MTQDEKQKALNLEVGQGMFQKFKDDHIGIPNISDAVYYTQAEADAYNAELTGALNSTDPLTAEEAAAYNAAVTGASKEAGDTLSSAEAAAYNATLEGAVSTSDIKTPAVPKKVKDYVDDGLSGKADLGNDGKVPSSQLPEIDTFPDQTGQSGKFLTTDGTDVSWAEVNMSAKADKLPMTGAGAATVNNFMAIDANGNIKDSGKKANDFQATLVVGTNLDSTPTANSNNPVTSGGVKAKNDEQDRKIDVLEQLAGAKLEPDINLSDPLMTSTSNPEVLAVCYAQGWCADATKMTYAEAMTVTDIGIVFKNNTSITHFEELQWFGITEIKEDAFNGAVKLTKIGIPPTVVSFGNNAFNGVSTIGEVYIRDLSAFCAIAGRSTNATMIPNRKTGCKLFLNGVYQTVLQIPEGITEIPSFCFGYFNFERVIVPKSVVMLKYRAFGNFTTGSVWYKHTMEELSDLSGDSYFDSSPNANANYQVYVDGTRIEGSISFPSGFTSVPDLRCTAVRSVIIGDSVTSIKTGCFERCVLLTSVTIGNSVASIDNAAFSGCSALTSVTIPNSVAFISNAVFDNCSALTSVTIGSGITSISYYAFRYCYLLGTIMVYRKTAPNIDVRQTDVGRDVVGSKILYVPSNATGYDTGNWKTIFLDNGWTLSKTLPAA